jgi:hypothetical protein
MNGKIPEPLTVGVIHPPHAIGIVCVCFPHLSIDPQPVMKLAQDDAVLQPDGDSQKIVEIKISRSRF